jgi:hypothetical protein
LVKESREWQLRNDHNLSGWRHQAQPVRDIIRLQCSKQYGRSAT